ncbi:hypothetical protein LCGC14_2628350, partial [marine sediment metagenome]
LQMDEMLFLLRNWQNKEKMFLFIVMMEIK